MSGARSQLRPSDRLASPLSRWVARSAATSTELWALRRRAWRETGVIVVRPDEVADGIARQALIDAAHALFGPAHPPYGRAPADGQEPSHGQTSRKEEP